MISLGYYEIGQLLRTVKMHGVSERWDRSASLIGIAFMAFGLQVILLWALGFPMTMYGEAAYKMFPAVAIILALLGTACVSAISMVCDRVPYAGTALAWLGKCSICLLAVHPTCGQLRSIWVEKLDWMGGGVSYLAEIVLIVLLMWALAGPLKLFWKMPRRDSGK